MEEGEEEKEQGNSIDREKGAVSESEARQQLRMKREKSEERLWLID